MTQATSTILGEIKLAGDLAGGNDANSPTLVNTGVTPGQYVVPTITVDAKGRIISASSGTNSAIAAILPEATTSQKGIAKIGSNINLTLTQTVGSDIINFGGTLTGASATGLPTNAPSFSFTLTIDGSTIKSVTVTPGTVATINDLISVLTPKISPAIIELVSGDLRIKSNTAGTCSTIRISNDQLFKFMTGYVSISAPIDGLGESTIYLDDASPTTKGVAKFGSGFTVDASGTANFNTSSITAASTTQKGVVQVGAGISVTNGLISTTSVPDATTTTKGVVQVGAGVNVSGGVISIPNASGSTKGIFKVGYGLKVSGGVLQLDTTKLATSNSAGLVMVGSGLSVTNGILSAGSSIASGTNLGMVKIGAGISVTGDGTISATPGVIPDATYSSKGIVQVGSGVSVTGGVISVPTASDTTLGIVRTGANITSSAGIISVVDATTSVKGAVQVGTNINVASGVISVNTATTGQKGLVQVGSNINVSGGVISISDAAVGTPGIASIGSGLTVAGGVVSTVTATGSVKGTVQIGSNITVNSGTISIPTASDTVAGAVKIGTGFASTAGVISALDATTSTKGVVKVGAGISVSSGTISINPADTTNYATTTSKGLVQIGSGLTVSGGVVSVPTATSSTAGILSVNTSVGLSVTNGQISAVLANGTTTLGVVRSGDLNNIDCQYGVINTGANVPLKNTANTYTKAQVVSIATPTFSSTMTLDLSTSNSFNFTATNNFTLANPTNQVAGGTFYIVVKQDATGGRGITWGTAFKFRGGTPPALSTAANAMDVISCVIMEGGFIATEVLRGFA